MKTIYDMRPPVIARGDMVSKAVWYTTEDGQRVPAVAKPSTRKEGQFRVEFGVFDIFQAGPFGQTEKRKHRLVWAMVSADRIAPYST